MAPASKPADEGRKERRKRKPDDGGAADDVSVVRLVARGRVSGQFQERAFRSLSPLASVSLKDIVSAELLSAGHDFLGFVNAGRHLVSYTRVQRYLPLFGEEDVIEGCDYTLYWWEFNLHRQLKMVQQVSLFADVEAAELSPYLHLHVCEWPGGGHSAPYLAVFGFDAPVTDADYLMVSLQGSEVSLKNYWYLSIAPYPPSTACPECSNTTYTGSAGPPQCLEHGYALHGCCEVSCPFPFPFQPTLQLRKDKVILLKEGTTLAARAVYLSPAGGEEGQVLCYAHRAEPPSGLSPPPSGAEEEEEGDGEEEDEDEDEDSPSSSPSSSSSSSEEPGATWIHGYVLYKRYHLRPPGTAEAEDIGGYGFLLATDLSGGHRKFPVLGAPPRDGRPSLVVEEMTLDVGRLLAALLRGDPLWDPQNRTADLDFLIMDVCPQNDAVLMGVGLFLKYEERRMQVSWDLGTGLCQVVGVCDLTNSAPFLRKNRRAVRSHRKWCVDAVMRCSVPGGAHRRPNVLDSDEDLRSGGTVLEDDQRCTWVMTAPGRVHAASQTDGGHPEVHPGDGGNPGMHPGDGGHPGMHPGDGGHPGVHPGDGGHPEVHPGDGGHPEVHPGDGGHPEVHPGDGGHPGGHPGDDDLPPGTGAPGQSDRQPGNPTT